jgi:hypothetical protein
MKKFNEEQSLSREKVFGDARTIVRVKDSTLGGKLQGEGLKLRPDGWKTRTARIVRRHAAPAPQPAPEQRGEEPGEDGEIEAVD